MRVSRQSAVLRFPEFIRFRDASDVDPKVFEALEAWTEE